MARYNVTDTQRGINRKNVPWREFSSYIDCATFNRMKKMNVGDTVEQCCEAHGKYPAFTTIIKRVS